MEAINPNGSWEQEPAPEQRSFYSMDLFEEINEKHTGHKKWTAVEMMTQRLNQLKKN